MVRKCFPWENKSHFMLIRREYLNLIIDIKSIHERKNGTLNTVVNDLIDERGGIVVFGKSLIKIPKVDTKSNCPLFLRNRKYIGNSFFQRHGIT